MKSSSRASNFIFGPLSDSARMRPNSAPHLALTDARHVLDRLPPWRCAWPPRAPPCRRVRLPPCCTHAPYLSEHRIPAHSPSLPLPSPGALSLLVPCSCALSTAESTMDGWPSSPRRVSTAPSFLVSIRVNHQLRRPLLGLSSPSSALLHRRGELPPENSSCRRCSRRPRVAKPPWATSGRAEASGG